MIQSRICIFGFCLTVGIFLLSSFPLPLSPSPSHPLPTGAHNTIVCTRAGKDLVSSLASGLLTIGDRFGGALDGAAKQFTEGEEEKEKHEIQLQKIREGEDE